MTVRGFGSAWCLLVAVTLCAVAATSREAPAFPSPSASPTPLPEVTSKPGRPRAGLLATIVPWPDAVYAPGARIRLVLILSNVSDGDIRTNLVYQPFADDVRVSVVNTNDPQGPQLAQAQNPVMSVVGPPPRALKAGEIHEYDIPLYLYTPEITKPGGYTVTVRLRVGTENGARVWLVTNEVQISVR